ncbi:MAG: glycosyl hydrolase family 2 [Dysgonomonadaceae bacterium]|nr:glycosyl hydrolase family 2 [Dysgonamonadaceae bacterium]
MNKKGIALFFFVMTTLLALAADDDTKWPQQTIECKPWTRWWWFGSAVDEKNLTYNIGKLGEAGIGGVEITPIYGVKGYEDKYIPYLSPKWMNMLSYTHNQAQKWGMQIDMNNGTGWPFGGPDVTLDNAACKAIFQEYHVSGNKETNLKIRVNDQKQQSIARLSRLMAYSDKGEKLDLTMLVNQDGTLKWKAPKGEWRLLALFEGRTLQQVKRAAPGGEGYVMDHLDADAVKKYLQKFDNVFAANHTPYPHTFFNDSYEVYGTNWSTTLLQEFYKRRGYKLENYFPELLDKGKTDRSRRVISDYRETLGEMLEENFTQQWTNWAHAHGAITRNQAHGSPANLINLYADVDIPECEIFGISDFNIPGLRKDSLIKKNDGDPITLKFASSAAHISGKKFTSAETFTWLTEHFRTSLSQCKPEIDQMFTSGVNHVFFHGTPYSPQEAPWPGWLFYATVNMSPTNSFWKDAPAFFSYIARVQSFLQYGKPDNDLLLYFPIYDCWYDQQDDPFLAFSIHDLHKLAPKFYETVGKIRESGRDVDYISDRYIFSATVENGRIKTIGGTTYKALIIPATKFLSPETVNKLYNLAAAGATILFIDQYPSDVPGLKASEQREKELHVILQKLPIVDFNTTQVHHVGKGLIITGKNYNELFDAAGIEGENFITQFKGQCIRRKNDSGYHYFFTLLSPNAIDNWVPLTVKATSAVFFDPLSGKSGKANIRHKNNTTEVYMQLQPGQSIILKTFTRKEADAPQWKYYQPTIEKITLDKGWKLSFIESEPTIPGTFDIDTLGSWTELKIENAKKNMGTARYITSFRIEKLSADEYWLNLGDVRESARIRINGMPVDTLFAVPFKTTVGKYLKIGENTLEIDVTNLPANRIADYDRKGIMWRIFHDINIVDINYQRTIYDKWETVPSGLLGPVTLESSSLKK